MTPPTFPLGSDLYALFFDHSIYNYRPGLVGKVQRVTNDTVTAGGKVFQRDDRIFGSEAEAVAYIEANPFGVPTIKA